MALEPTYPSSVARRNCSFDIHPAIVNSVERASSLLKPRMHTCAACTRIRSVARTYARPHILEWALRLCPATVVDNA